MRGPTPIQVAAVLALAGAAHAAPTCPLLLTSFERSLATAASVTIAVTLEQGGREIAFERSRVDRTPDGERTAVTLERRGLRRPDANAANGEATTPTPGGALPTCDDHDVSFDGDFATLTLRSGDPDAPAPTVTLRFVEGTGAWLPTSLEAPFTIRVLFLPVRGRFLTTFDAWSFPTTPLTPQEDTR